MTGDFARTMADREGLRESARRLRQAGWSIQDIAVEVGVAKSTAWSWTRDLPLDPDSARARQKRAHAELMSAERWARHRVERDRARTRAREEAAAAVGGLTGRELLLLGAVAYWCEGAKAKPWRPHDCRVVFINSDPVLLSLFLRFVEQRGISRSSLTYRLSIHESADAEQAARWWAQRLDLPPERFKKATVKRHVPETSRRNTGDTYHGCLIIAVPASRGLYWYIEGVLDAIADRSM